MNWPTQRDSEADVLSVNPSSERIKEVWVVCGLYTKMELRCWLVPGNVKTTVTELNEKLFVNTVRIKSAIKKMF